MPNRRAHEPTIRSRGRTLNRTQAGRPSAVPHASHCIVQRSIPAPQSISRRGAGLWPATVFRVTTWRGGRAQSLGIRRSAKRSLWPTRISLSKHQRPQTRCPRLSPRRACGFRPGGERQQMPTMTRPSRVTRRAEPVPKEKHRAKHRGLIRLPLRACRNSVPLVGNLRRPPGARPLQTAPEGKTRAQGSRISGN